MKIIILIICIVIYGIITYFNNKEINDYIKKLKKKGKNDEKNE